MSNALIAVIDDDELVRNSTSSLLRSLGYSAALYASADEFLSAGEHGVDCVLSDLQMPGRSGFDLRVELNKRGSLVPMILMTAFPTPSIHAQAVTLAMAGLLEKPLSPDRLVGALERVLGQVEDPRASL